MKTVFLRALEATDKESALRAAIREPEAALEKQRFEVDTKSFAAISRSPFAYWVSERIRRLFKGLPLFEVEGRTARQGLASADDFRFVRSWWEVLPQQIRERWFPFAKGGKFSPFYADVYLVINWENGGSDVYGYHKAVVRNPGFYFRCGLTWPRRTKSELSVRVMPAGCIFADKGPAVFAENDNVDQLLILLALFSSSAFRALVELQLAAADASPGGAAHSYEVGIIQRTPIPPVSPEDAEAFCALAGRIWLLKRLLDIGNEVSHAFILPVVLRVKGGTLAARATAYAEQIATTEAEVVTLRAEIDARCLGLYGIDEADRRVIADGFSGGVEGVRELTEEMDINQDNNVDDEIGIDAATLTTKLVSWMVGIAFGRFDVRFATDACPPHIEPKPFDPLPVCSPAMLTGDDGLPLTNAPADYPLTFPDNGILVDDPGHPRDLTTAVRTVFEVVFGDRADAIWQEAAALLSPKDHDLRTWLVSAFFEYHLKCYSKSRRKAPILWQLGVPSGRYSVWLYALRLTRDSFFQIQNEVVEPKLLYEERQLTSLIQEAGVSPSTKERKQIAAQEDFVEELRALLEEVRRVAPTWNPTLDDGVVLTMAPLWRLVPRHKSWQRELKSKWEELVAGKYDWAHIAMHLWPERVTAKCASDRSLAIAHGLDE
jgi:hypothetical protein